MRVAVVSASIGGLTLAAALHRKSPTTHIELYERDAAPFERPQGYAIGLKHDGGLAALAQLGLREAALSGDTTPVAAIVKSPILPDPPLISELPNRSRRLTRPGSRNRCMCVACSRQREE